MRKIFKFLLISLFLLPSCSDQIVADNRNNSDSEQSEQFEVKRQSNITCIAPPRAFDKFSLGFERYFENLNFQLPLAMVQAPNDNNFWYILEKGGVVYKVANNPQANVKEEFLNFTEEVVTNIEAGLLNLTFHPDFENNGKVYVYYSAPVAGVDYQTCPTFACPTMGVLSEFTMNGNGTEVDKSSEKVLISFEKPSEIHFGGGMFFGPDGYLYLSIGDGTTKSAESPAQDLYDIKGKLIRIDVDNGDPYDIPPDNPYILGEGLPEIYAFGFRNPWRWSFDKDEGLIWMADVGALNIEEINIVEKGLNYGWPIFEGNSCRIGELCDSDTFQVPVSFYTHDDGCAIIGGYVYRGMEVPDLYGSYIFGDLCDGKIFGISSVNTEDHSPVLLEVLNATLFSFAEDHDGEIFVINGDLGDVYKITDYQFNTTEVLPDKLSDVGCFQKTDLDTTTSGVYPYKVNVPLWSDGASKDRWVAIPDDLYIDINNDNGKWNLPVGSVLIKSFALNEEKIETRFLMNHKDGGWRGYSYEWNEEQNEAYLVDSDGKDLILSNGQQWRIPGRNQCFSCHTNAAGKTLGLENLQLNRLFKNPTSGNRENQIEFFIKINILSAETDIDLLNLPSFLNFEEVVPSENNIKEFARAYLHVNCSMCHRPQGPGIGPANFLSSINFENMNICNVSPSITNLGIEDSKLFTPGKPELSIMMHRMNSLDENRMPPLGSYIVDENGLEIIVDWIESMNSCN